MVMDLPINVKELNGVYVPFIIARDLKTPLGIAKFVKTIVRDVAKGISVVKHYCNINNVDSIVWLTPQGYIHVSNSEYRFKINTQTFELMRMIVNKGELAKYSSKCRNIEKRGTDIYKIAKTSKDNGFLIDANLVDYDSEKLWKALKQNKEVYVINAKGGTIDHKCYRPLKGDSYIDEEGTKINYTEEEYTEVAIEGLKKDGIVSYDELLECDSDIEYYGMSDYTVHNIVNKVAKDKGYKLRVIDKSDNILKHIGRVEDKKIVYIVK